MDAILSIIREKFDTWSTVQERQTNVAEHHRRGTSIVDIAHLLQPTVHIKTVTRDFIALGLTSFSLISDEALAVAVLQIIQTLHPSVGLRTVEAALIAPPRCLRIQERRILRMLVCMFSFVR